MDKTGLLNAEILENLQQQYSELELLQSIFPLPGEIKFEDKQILQQLERYINQGEINTNPPQFIDFTLNITVNKHKFELCVTLSNEYPKIKPDMYIRCETLDKNQHALLNQNALTFLSENCEPGEVCIYNIASWLQDNAENYLVPISIEITKESEITNTDLIRMWIYSHHIYNKTKRKEILNLAHTLKLTGFCLPGKPGIICVEGPDVDCNTWWQSIKSMTWQKIFCKATETCKNPDTFRRFKSFDEIAFQVSGNRGNHMDMGELYKFLCEHKLEFIFKELFGIEGKMP